VFKAVLETRAREDMMSTNTEKLIAVVGFFTFAGLSELDTEFAEQLNAVIGDYQEPWDTLRDPASASPVNPASAMQMVVHGHERLLAFADENAPTIDALHQAMEELKEKFTS
jgi:hypothetical protein